MLRQDTLHDTYVNVIMPDKLVLDLEYMAHRSLLVDLDILWHTILVLLPRFAEVSPEIEDLLFGPMQRFIRRHLSWFTLDFLLGLLTVGTVGVAWRQVVGPFNVGRLRLAALAFGTAVTFSLVNQLWGLQHSLWSHSSGREVIDLLLATASSTALLIVAGGVVFDLPWEWGAIVGLVSCALFTSARYRKRLIHELLLRYDTLWRHEFATNCERWLIVGTTDVAQLLARRVCGQRSGQRFRVVGFVDDDLTKRGARLHGLRVLGTYRAIPALVDVHKVDRIVVALENPGAAQRQAILDLCYSTPAQVQVVPDIFGFVRDPDSLATGRASDGSNDATRVTA
jgi:FlaA1/EpsC-like NDP-sugar epimerase